MAQTGNDIVISAKAQTKDAEKSLEQLDKKIVALGTSDKNIKKAEKAMADFGKKSKEVAIEVEKDTKEMATSTEALAGAWSSATATFAAVTGTVMLITRGLDSLTQADIDAANASKTLADIHSQGVDKINARSNELMSTLTELDKMAEEGVLDNEAIELENKLVSELNNIWGDVGISIDSATGKLGGLLEAQQKINNLSKEARLEALQKQKEATQAKLEADKAKHSSTFREDDSSYGYTLKGTASYVGSDPLGAIATALTMDTSQLDADYAESMANIKQDEASLADIEAQIKQLKSGTATEDLSKKVQQEQARSTANGNLQAGYSDVRSFDARQKELELNYSNALITGDGSREKAELDAYMQQKNEAELERVKKELEVEKKNNADLQKRYENGLKHNDPIEAEKRQKELIASNDKISKLTDKAISLNSVLKPAEIAKEAVIADKISSSARGTFDSRSLGSLGQNDVEKQQLEQLKLIAQNTKEDKLPIVGA